MRPGTIVGDGGSCVLVHAAADPRGVVPLLVAVNEGLPIILICLVPGTWYLVPGRQWSLSKHSTSTYDRVKPSHSTVQYNKINSRADKHIWQIHLRAW